MLRIALVALLGVVFTYYALQGAFYSLLFYLWIAYFRPESWVWSGAIAQMNLSLIVGIFLIGVTLLSAPRFRVNAQVVFLFLFLGLSIVSLSIATAQTQEDAWRALQDFTKTVLITYLIVILVTDRKRFRIALLVLAVSLGAEQAKQAWVQLLVNPGGKNFNDLTFLGDENHVGVGMLMLVPLIGALMRTSRYRWERYGHLFMLVGILYRGISTYSRGAFLGAGALAVTSVLRARHKVRTAIVTIAVAAVIVPVLPQSFWDRMNTITTKEDDMEKSSRSRLHFWRVAVAMADSSPLTGIGFSAFMSAYDTFDTSHGEFGHRRAVHSSWFNVLADLGYTGLLLFVLNIVGVFVGSWQVHWLSRRRPEMRELRDYAAAFEQSLAAFAVSGSFVSFTYIEMLWHVIGFNIALVFIARDEAAALEAAVPTPAPAALAPVHAALGPAPAATAPAASPSPGWIAALTETR